jgi:hypothetical protein
VLFSNDRVAQYINKNFEPTWESVRPVPTVTVDFGNGKTIRRTLRGNIATYVCDSQGRTLDILPGIYEPETYLEQLKQLKLLSQWVKQSERAGSKQVANNLADKIVETMVKQYHSDQHVALTDGKARRKIFEVKLSISKARIEKSVFYVLTPTSKKHHHALSDPRANLPNAIPDLHSPSKLAEWKPLFEDTKLNESVRRLQIHKYLADKGLVAPAEMTKWLYREVLDADLDDPSLGLGKLLKAGS